MCHTKCKHRRCGALLFVSHPDFDLGTAAVNPLKCHQPVLTTRSQIERTSFVLPQHIEHLHNTCTRMPAFTGAETPIKIEVGQKVNKMKKERKHARVSQCGPLMSDTRQGKKAQQPTGQPQRLKMSAACDGHKV